MHQAAVAKRKKKRDLVGGTELLSKATRTRTEVCLAADGVSDPTTNRLRPCTSLRKIAIVFEWLILLTESWQSYRTLHFYLSLWDSSNRISWSTQSFCPVDIYIVIGAFQTATKASYTAESVLSIAKSNYVGAFAKDEEFRRVLWSYDGTRLLDAATLVAEPRTAASN